jgi:hypothetical protein
VSRYLLLVLLNMPLITMALLGALVDYKTGKLSRQKYLTQTILWVVVLFGLVSAKYIYEFLFSNNLTATEPLSLFDVVEVTGIVFLLYLANRSRTKAERLERRVQDLHQELSILLSENITKRRRR